MKASIIIRAYNAEQTIERALKSALDQDFPKGDFEVVVVDDGSTDGTAEIVKRYEKVQNVRIVKQKNQGAVKAANHGFALGAGEFLTLLDSDDSFEPSLLATTVPILAENPDLDFVYSDYYEVVGGSRKIILIQGNIFSAIAEGILFRANSLKAAGYYRENVSFAEYDLFLRTYYVWKSHYIPEPLFSYIRRSQSIASNDNWTMEALTQLRRLHPDQIDLIDQIRNYSINGN